MFTLSLTRLFFYFLVKENKTNTTCLTKKKTNTTSLKTSFFFFFFCFYLGRVKNTLCVGDVTVTRIKYIKIPTKNISVFIFFLSLTVFPLLRYDDETRLHETYLSLALVLLLLPGSLKILQNPNPIRQYIN